MEILGKSENGREFAETFARVWERMHPHEELAVIILPKEDVKTRRQVIEAAVERLQIELGACVIPKPKHLGVKNKLRQMLRFPKR